MSMTRVSGVESRQSGLVQIRPAQITDRDGLRALHANASDQSIYFRYFTANRRSADAYLETLLRPLSAQHQVLVATIRGQIVGVAGFEGVDAVTAEIALLIDDAHQHAGIGTLLLEQLVGLARRLAFGRLVADVLSVNNAMLHVFHSLGFDVTSHSKQGIVRIEFDLDAKIRLAPEVRGPSSY